MAVDLLFPATIFGGRPGATHARVAAIMRFIEEPLEGREDGDGISVLIVHCRHSPPPPPTLTKTITTTTITTTAATINCLQVLQLALPPAFTSSVSARPTSFEAESVGGSLFSLVKVDRTQLAALKHPPRPNFKVATSRRNIAFSCLNTIKVRRCTRFHYVCLSKGCSSLLPCLGTKAGEHACQHI